MKNIFLLFAIIILSCSNPKKEFLEKNPNLPSEKVIAINRGDVINGMTEEELEVSMGKPTFIDKKLVESGVYIWIYRDTSGTKQSEAYSNESSFPQGIGAIVPLQYNCKEIRVYVKDSQVFKIEKILRF